MKHDAWMNDLFWGRNSILSHAHMSSVLCDLCNDCTCENVKCGRCICLQYWRCSQHCHSFAGGLQLFSECCNADLVVSRNLCTT